MTVMLQRDGSRGRGGNRTFVIRANRTARKRVCNTKETKKTGDDSAIAADTRSGVAPFVYQADTNTSSPSSFSFYARHLISVCPAVAILDFLHIISTSICQFSPVVSSVDCSSSFDPLFTVYIARV